MNLHESMLNDLDEVFFELDDFACVHGINGKKIACVVDENDKPMQTGSLDGFANVSGIGVLDGSRTVYCKALELVPQPLPGEKLIMDNNYWLVRDVSETEGMITMHLQRAY